MYTLIIETSGNDSFVALCKEGKVLVSEMLPQKEQSKHLFPAIRNCLSTKNLTLKDLDCICVGNGPGSFTGTRVGVMAAKALSFASDTPLITFCSLERFALPKRGPFIIALNAKSKGFYTLEGEKRRGGVHFYGPPTLLSLSEIKKINLTKSTSLSPDAELLQTLVPNAPWIKTSSDIASVAEMACARFKKGERSAHFEVKTCYLHTP